jgi:hypothetical protein
LVTPVSNAEQAMIVEDEFIEALRGQTAVRSSVSRLFGCRARLQSVIVPRIYRI